MDLIAEIKRRLVGYPELSYTETDNWLEVAACSPTEFSVGISIDPGEYTVYFEGWHQHFDSPDEALDWFAMGLISGTCRLVVIYRGDTPVSFTLEVREEERWTSHSTTGLIFRPFWRRKRTVCLTNPQRAAA